VCGTSIPSDSAYCPACGTRIPRRWRYRFVGTYPFPRFQIDPAQPQPQRDVRWPAMVAGIGLIVLSVSLLAVYAIVSSAASGSAFACATRRVAAACVAPVLEYLFLVPGLVLLAVGAVLLVAVFRDLG
jgi:hypothetical protein